MWDTHLHTSFSGDCNTKPETMIKEGMNRGLTGMVFTDHLDWNYPNEPGRFDLNIYEYRDTIKKLSREYTDLEIGCGIELGMQPHLAERHREFLHKITFDQVIGSVHVVDGRDPYYPEFFAGRSADEAYAEYFECIKKNLEVFNEFDTLGHLDYVVRYGIRHKGDFGGRMNFLRHKHVIGDILDFLIKNGKSLEINTGSFRNRMNVPNPSYEIIRFYQEMGGKNITLGSDAHKPENIADGFAEVSERLRALGFTHYNVYVLRAARELPL